MNEKVIYLSAGPENIEGLLIVNALIKSQTVLLSEHKLVLTYFLHCVSRLHLQMFTGGCSCLVIRIRIHN